MDRNKHLQRGIRLEAFTIGWNVLEGCIAVGAGIVAGSIALTAFGFDSFIETTSGIVLLLHLRDQAREQSENAREAAERRATMIAGALLMILAVVVGFESVRRLAGFGSEAKESTLGLILTGVSLVVMPILAWAKLKTAAALKSRALRADGFETITCAWLSATTLGGLALNAAFGWHWADPAAALVLVPLIFREGLESWRGECHCAGDH